MLIQGEGLDEKLKVSAPHACVRVNGPISHVTGAFLYIWQIVLRDFLLRWHFAVSNYCVG